MSASKQNEDDSALDVARGSASEVVANKLAANHLITWQDAAALLHENQILTHALRLVADDKANPEGWTTDAQIARHYLEKTGLKPNMKLSNTGPAGHAAEDGASSGVALK